MKSGLADLAAAGFDRLAEQAAGDPRKLAAVAAMALSLGKGDAAYRLAREARALAPEDRDIAGQTAAAIAGGVPAWHFSIVRDDVRNAAWEAAIRRAVGPQTRVLDIGAGTGLLAMMAARAGAAAVTSCEMNPAVADAASDIVAANGLADRVRIVARHSEELDPERDMGGRADLFVSEIVSNDLLGQGALGIVADAARRLLAPGARVIPAAGVVRVALAWWEGLAAQRLGEVAGFDLSAFNRLERIPYRIRVGDPRLSLAGDAADLFAFDFASGGPFAAGRASADLVAAARPANGVAQWIRLQLDEEGAYENRPAEGASSCWLCLFTPLAEEVAKGQGVRVHGAHNKLELRIWADSASS